MEISDCEKDGYADDSVPDCDSKVNIPATWSKWSSWSNCQSDYRGKQGKVIYSYKQSQKCSIFNNKQILGHMVRTRVCTPGKKDNEETGEVDKVPCDGQAFESRGKTI